MIRRRTLIRTGLVGAVALGGAAWWTRSHRTGTGTQAASITLTLSLNPADRRFLAAVAAVVLPSAPPAEVVEAAAVALRQLAPSAQAEFSELLSLMSIRPVVGVLTGVWSAWEEADASSVQAFLERWRHSRVGLLQSGYHALHDVLLGAWYAQDHTWAALGYPGPPVGLLSRSGVAS